LLCDRTRAHHPMAPTHAAPRMHHAASSTNRAPPVVGVPVDMMRGHGTSKVVGPTTHRCYDPRAGATLLLSYDDARGAFDLVDEDRTGPPSLTKMVDVISWQLFGVSADSMSLRDLLHRACAMLDLPTNGAPMLVLARRCHALLTMSVEERAMAETPVSAGQPTPQPAADAPPAIPHPDSILLVPQLDLSPAQPSALPEDCTGPSPTERSDRSASERESPPRVLRDAGTLVLDMRRSTLRTASNGKIGGRSADRSSSSAIAALRARSFMPQAACTPQVELVRISLPQQIC